MKTSPQRVLLLACVLAAAACDTGEPGSEAPLQEGQRLDVVSYRMPQPTSREAYADFAVFTVYDGGVFIVDPGTSPADPPRLVRSLRVPDLLVTSAQIDRQGYVWLATPDLRRNGNPGGPHNRAYVLDPHAGTVARVVSLPTELRAVADLAIGPEQVYVRAWRDGFSGGVGTIPRACVSDAAQCSATLLTELGNVGGTPERAFCLTSDALYSFALPNSRDERRSLDRIDPATGEITASSPNASGFDFDGSSFYTVAQFEPGLNLLLRLDAETLEETARVPAGLNAAVVAVQGPYVYLSNYVSGTVDVRSAETLEMVRTFDVSGAGGVSYTFGFVAPDVLMLNGTYSLDVSSGELLHDPATVEVGGLPLAVRLPEGHPLAY